MATVFVLAKIQVGTIDQTLDAINKVEGVVRALPVTGAYDLLIEINAESIALALNIVRYHIHELETIKSTETLVTVPW